MAGVTIVRAGFKSSFNFGAHVLSLLAQLLTENLALQERHLSQMLSHRLSRCQSYDTLPTLRSLRVHPLNRTVRSRFLVKSQTAGMEIISFYTAKQAPSVESESSPEVTLHCFVFLLISLRPTHSLNSWLHQYSLRYLEKKTLEKKQFVMSRLITAKDG